MTYFVTYNNLTGGLLDVSYGCPSAQESIISVKTCVGETPDLYAYKWDTELREFVPKADILRQVTVHAFMNRMSAQERIAIKDAAKTNMALQDYMDMLNSASFVDLSDQELFGGLSYLVYLGLLDTTRVTEILA